MKLYTEEQVRKAINDAYWCCSKLEVECVFDKLTPIELPSDEVLMEHIDYLISCRQNLIDNADNMPQHLLEGGCIAFESAIDNARELFFGGNK